MKKKVALLICAGMIAGLSGGCGSEEKGTADKENSSTAEDGTEEAGDEIKLTFWKSPHSDREDEIWADIIEGFNEENPNIQVEFLNVAWDSVVEKETAAFAAGSGPDISFQNEQFPLYAKNGYLLALDDYVDDEKLAGYPESALEYCSQDGKLMGIPFVALDSVMFYNKDMFEEAGITEVPKNWDELLEAARKLTKDTDGDGEIDQWGMMFEMNDYWQPLTYIIQAGGDLWNENRTNIGFNNEAGIEGLEFYNKLYNEEKVVLPLDKYTSIDEERSYFYNSQVAMCPSQIHMATTIREASDINLGAFDMPAGPADDPEHKN